MREWEGFGGVPLPRDGTGIVVSSSYDHSQPPLMVVAVDNSGSDVGLEERVVVAGELGGGMKTTCLTCAGGGAGLTSLREGRRHTAAFLRRP